MSLVLFRSSFLNQGEICLCTSRVFVQRAAYDQFLARLVAAVAELRVGDPLDEATFCGAVNSRAHYDKVEHESVHVHSLSWNAA